MGVAEEWAFHKTFRRYGTHVRHRAEGLLGLCGFSFFFWSVCVCVCRSLTGLEPGSSQCVTGCHRSVWLLWVDYGSTGSFASSLTRCQRCRQNRKWRNKLGDLVAHIPPPPLLRIRFSFSFSFLFFSFVAFAVNNLRVRNDADAYPSEKVGTLDFFVCFLYYWLGNNIPLALVKDSDWLIGYWMESNQWEWLGGVLHFRLG